MEPIPKITIVYHPESQIEKLRKESHPNKQFPIACIADVNSKISLQKNIIGYTIRKGLVNEENLFIFPQIIFDMVKNEFFSLDLERKSALVKIDKDTYKLYLGVDESDAITFKYTTEIFV